MTKKTSSNNEKTKIQDAERGRNKRVAGTRVRRTKARRAKDKRIQKEGPRKKKRNKRTPHGEPKRAVKQNKARVNGNDN